MTRRVLSSGRSAASGRCLAAVASSLLVAATIVAVPMSPSPAGATVPGRPGIPQPATSLYTEDFSAQDATAAAIDIVDYQGAPGTNYVPGISGASSETYGADPNWQGSGNRCNGWIVNSSSPTPPIWPSNCSLDAVRLLAQRLGQFQGMTSSAALRNQAVTAYTGGTTATGPGVQLLTEEPIPAVAGHFYQVSVLFGEANCPNGATKARERLTLIVDGQRNVIGENLIPCTDPNRVDYGGGVVVAPLTSGVIRLPSIGTPQLQLEIYNAEGSGGGNDVAFDLPQIMDVTPQLDKAFSPSTIGAGGVSTLTFTITNTLELAAKNGWSFTDVLPAGVVPTGVNSTTCAGGVVTATAGASQVGVTGSLTQGQTSCSVTVQVGAASPGTYVNGPENFPAGTAGLLGLNPPGAATLTVQPPASLIVSKSSTTTAITTVGQLVPYKFLVENRGTATLTGLQVVDTQLAPASQENLSAISCPVTALGPSDSTTCVATYRVTQADLDHGSVSDTAVATAVRPGGATVTTPVARLTIGGPAPAIRVVKSSSTQVVTTVGQQVEYSFEVTNTGNVALSDVSVTDTQQSPAVQQNMTAVTCPTAPLAPGTSMTCTGTYTSTQVDLANGSIADTAVASATAPDGGAVESAPSSLSIPATLPGSLSIVKASTVQVLTGVGQQIPYTFTVTNNSAVVISGITVVDTQQAPALPANMSAITCPQTTLAAGASTVCTGTYTLTRADFGFGQLTDSAFARGTDPGGTQVVSSPSTLTRTVAVATLSVQKTTDVASVSSVGQQVPYEFLVTNTGNQTVSAIAVTDTQTPPASQANMTPVTCPQTTLAPGASTTCTGTYTTTAADLLNGSVNDSAVASGTAAGGPVASPQSSASLAVVTEPLSLIKSSTSDVIAEVGQQIEYSFTVTNHSEVVYSGLEIDDQVAPPASSGGLSPVVCPQTTIAPGASVTCTVTYTVTVDDLVHGSVTDIATATATDPGGEEFVAGPSSMVLPLDPDPALEIAKASTTTAITSAGQVVPYTFTVTNTGNQTLTGIVVTDTVTPPSDPAGLSAITCPTTTLLPAESTVCTASYTVRQADVDAGVVSDSAVATGLDPDGQQVDAPASEYSIAVTAAPSYTIVKASTTQTVSARDEVIPYTFTVTNTGNQTLTALRVVDVVLAPGSPDRLSAVVCPSTTLAPAQVVICTASYTTAQADLDHGTITDIATPQATAPDGSTVTAPGSFVTVQVDQQPALTLRKSAFPLAEEDFEAGEVVTYTYVVSNTGNVTITDIAIDETAFTGSGSPPVPVCAATVLAPGAQTLCTATYTVTQTDVDEGLVANTAVATGEPPLGGPVTSPPSSAVTPFPPTPALSIVKSASPLTVSAPGAEIDYEYLVTNTGNVTLSAVAVAESDDGFSGSGPLPEPDCPAAVLAPGQFQVCTASYTVTQTDIDAGAVSNTASALGTAPDETEPTASPPSTAVVEVDGAPSLSVLKASTDTAVTHVGQVVPYTYTVTNTGNQTLSALVVIDTVAAPSDPADLTAVSCPVAVLAPQQVTTCTADYTVSQADIDFGSIADSAVATAVPPGALEPLSSEPSPLTLPVTGQSASLTIEKTADASALGSPGQAIVYSFVVTNTGTLTLDGVAVEDTQAYPDDVLEGAPVCPATTLAPGRSTTCTATFLVTPAAFARGRVADTAVATATTPDDEAVASAQDELALAVAPVVPEEPVEPGGPADPDGELPVTGGTAASWIPGIVLVGSGALLFVVARRRRHRDAV